MGPEFFQTPMGKRFYESTVPRIAESLEKLTRVNEQLLKRMSPQTTPVQPPAAAATFKDPYVSLEIPNTDITIQVKLEGEGVCVNAVTNGTQLASVWKLYDEMANPEEDDCDDDEEETNES